MHRLSLASRRRFAERAALPMFGCSLLFLAAVATLIVVWVDVPRLSDHADTGTGDTLITQGQRATQGGVSLTTSPREQAVLAAGFACLAILGFLWPVFLLEFLIQFLIRDRTVPYWRHRYYGLIICFCPPLRLCARNHDMEKKIWLPSIGWQEVDTSFRDRLERVFSVPMLVIAMLILPVLLVEFCMKDQMAEYLWLRIVLHISTGLIWFAFAAEFIVMVSVADKKLRYCKQHWLDLAIILLPLISFLRSLRVVRATRVARLAKVQQITKMSRLYRLRGLAMRAFRGLLLLELINRVIGVNPERRLRKLQEQLREKEAELTELRRVIADLEEQIADSKKVPAAK